MKQRRFNGAETQHLIQSGCLYACLPGDNTRNLILSTFRGNTQTVHVSICDVICKIALTSHLMNKYMQIITCIHMCTYSQSEDLNKERSIMSVCRDVSADFLQSDHICLSGNADLFINHHSNTRYFIVLYRERSHTLKH